MLILGCKTEFILYNYEHLTMITKDNLLNLDT